MDINIHSPVKRRVKKKKISLQNIISISILMFCILISSTFTGKMFFKMYQYSTLKSEYNSIVELNSTLCQKNTELNHLYASKKTEYKTIQNKYDELIAKSPIAYLTFDDGPSDNTLKLLDILDKYNVKSTFFVVYKEGYDDVYREIVKRGHVLANHTYSHQYGNIYASPDAFIENILKLDKRLEEITGAPPSKILRFPGGSNTGFLPQANAKLIKAKISELGYTFFDWNVDSTDASAPTQQKKAIISGVLNGADLVNTANILLHDTNMKSTTVEAMPEIIEGLKSKGYRFKGLDHDSAKIQF